MKYLFLFLIFIGYNSYSQHFMSTGVLYVNGCVSPSPITGQTFIDSFGYSQLSSSTVGGSWSSSNTSIASAGTSGIITGVSSGTAIITYSTSGTCYTTTTVTVVGLFMVGSPVAVWDCGTQTRVTISTGVSQITDASGAGHHLLQATSANQPAFINDGGMSYFSTDGVIGVNGDYLQALWTLPQPATYVIVLRQHWLAGQSILGGSVVNTRQVFMTGLIPNICLVAAVALAPNSIYLIDNSWKVLTITWNGVSSTISVNDLNTVTGNPGSASSGGVTIGRDANDNSTCSNVDVMWFGVWGSVLSAGNQSLIVSGLRRYKNI